MWHGDIPKIDRPFEPMKASPVLFPLNSTEVNFFPFVRYPMDPITEGLKKDLQVTQQDANLD